MGSLFEEMTEAHRAIRPQVSVTPLEHSPLLSAELGCELYFKCEHHQPSGSFKIRGATNKIRSLDAEAQRRGVFTASTGNHGLAVARAAKLAGIPATVYVAANAAPSKVAGIRALGAKLMVVDGASFDAELAGRQQAEAEGAVYISPYNDREVVVGQGTLGIELMEQDHALDAIFIATGAGGLMGGTGTAVKAINPAVQMIGVWPEASPVMLRALEAGRLVAVEEFPTLSDGTTGAIEPDSITFPLCQQVIDDRITVGEDEIATAMRRIAETEHWIVEGAAGAAFAGLIQQAHAWRGKRVAVVLCGRNIGHDTFRDAVAG